MNHRHTSAGLVLGSTLLLTGCPPPPPVTVTLPGGITCAGTLDASVTASIAPEPGTLRPKLTARVCVTCNDTPLGGVSGITAAFVSSVPLPATIPATPITLDATASNGCVSKSYILPTDSIRGQQVTVTVVDAAGTTVSTDTGTIQ